MVQTDEESLVHVKFCQFISGENLARRKSSQFFSYAISKYMLNDQNKGWEKKKKKSSFMNLTSKTESQF